MILRRTNLRRTPRALRLYVGLFFAIALLVPQLLAIPSASAATAKTVVSIEFDDGWESAYQAGAILSADGMDGTFYVISGFVGQTDFMTWAQLHTLAGEGNEIGGHTIDHTELTTLNATEQAREICNDRENLINEGFQPTSFAYPDGAFDPGTESIVQQCGYNSARTVGGVLKYNGTYCPQNPSGSVQPPSPCVTAETIPPLDAYATRTAGTIESTDTPAQIEQLVTQAQNNGGGWVQLVFHQICNGTCPGESDPVDDDATPATLTAVAAWLKTQETNNTVVETVGQAIGGSFQPGVPGPPAPPAETGPQILPNGNLSNTTGADVPDCYQIGGYGTNTPSYTWSPVGTSGAGSETVNVSGYSNGVAGVVTTQDQGTCSPSITPGQTYSVSVTYTSTAPVYLQVWYRNTFGTWLYWTGENNASPASSTSTVANFNAGAAPSDATAISVGLMLAQNGTLTTTNYAVGTTGTTPAPAVTGISPTSGPTTGGTTVTITGTGFTGATGVSFGGTAATKVTVVSSTQVTAVSPAESAGAVDVTVTTPQGTSPTVAADKFTYTTVSAAPAVTGISPTSGPTTGGTTVTITGTGFTGATGVSFGGTAATKVTVVSSTQVTAVSPAESAGAVDVTVTTPQGTSPTVAADKFTYTTVSAAPAVTGISPTSGPTTGGTTVTITGTGFTGATGVSFGGTAATKVTVVSSTQVTAVSPAESAGAVDVTVTTPQGTSPTVAADKFTYTTVSAAPAVTGISPTSGPTTGGTTVTITGTGFTGATGVSFGGTAASNVTVVSSTQVTAVSPAESAGAVDVTVTTPQGTSPTVAADKFTYTTVSAAPAVTGISPTSGPTTGGTTVTITGTGFTGATGVSFGGTAASNVTVVSSTQVTAVSPAESAGAVDVTVTTPQGTSPTVAADKFTYASGTTGPTLQNPLLESSSGGVPTCWEDGGYGTNTATFTLGTNGPAGGDEETVAVSAYTNGDEKLVVSQSTPSCAPTITPGQSYTLGASYEASVAGTAFVVFYETSAGAWDYWTSGPDLPAESTWTSATFTTPAAPTGAVAISFGVTIVSKGTLSTGNYSLTTVGGVSAAPAVTGISPTSGPTTGGTTVTITGTGFTGATGVSFGGTAATKVTVVSSTQVTAVSPAESAGAVDVTVTTPQGTSPTVAADKFTYTTVSAAPAVTGISPTSGPTTGGTTVTITGTGFTGATGVSFGGTAATKVTVVSSTQVTAVSPAESAGAVDVTVTTPQGTSPTVAADKFTYTTVSAAPAVTGISPTSGPTTGGTTVTITGTGFTGATGVSFGGTAASNVTVVSSTQVTAVSPAESAGAVDVTVTTPQGTSPTVAADKFTYTTVSAAPAVTGISPTSGPTTGGTTVTITGTGFTGATGVSFGGTAASNVTVVSSTQVTAVSPAESAGAVDVTVTTPQGTSPTVAADKFTYASGTTGPTLQNPLLESSSGGVPTCWEDGGYGTNTATFTLGTNGPAGGDEETVAVSAYTNGDEKLVVSQSTPSCAPTITPGQSYTLGASYEASVAGTAFVVFYETSAGAWDYWTSGPDLPAESTWTSATFTTPAAPTGAVAISFGVTIVSKGTLSTGNYSLTTVGGVSAAPAVTGISPTSGPTTGGTTVTITGTGFTGATGVSFGGTAATKVTVVSSTQVTAVSPAESAGAVDVTVTTPQGTSPTVAADKFTY